MRVRALGGKTNLWGRLALRMSDYDFKAASRDGYGVDWPIGYSDIKPYYDKVDQLLGVSGHPEGLDHVPDGIFQRPTKFTDAEIHMRRKLGDMGRVLTPYRAGVTTDGRASQQVPQPLLGAGGLHRRAGGCDIHAAFDSPTGLIYPAMETGKLALRPNSVVREVLVDTAHRAGPEGVAFTDGATRKSYEAKARVVMLAASTLESARLLLLSKSRQHANGIGNSSGHVGHNFCEHLMGPGVTGLLKDLVGKRAHAGRRAAGRLLPGAVSQPGPQAKAAGFIRGYGFEGGSGTGMFAGVATAKRIPGFGAAWKKAGAGPRRGLHRTWAAFGEVLPRFENQVALDPKVRDRHGIPVLNFNIQYGDNEKKMAEDMAATAKRDVRGGGDGDHRAPHRRSARWAGPSTSWARPAWATTPRRRW